MSRSPRLEPNYSELPNRHDSICARAALRDQVAIIDKRVRDTAPRLMTMPKGIGSEVIE